MNAWRADPLVWGYGPRVFEVFLEPTCPFSPQGFRQTASGESNANLTPGGWGERMTSTKGSRVKAAIGVSITDPVANIGLRNDRCRH